MTGRSSGELRGRPPAGKGWIKQADADKARKDPLIVTNRTNAAHIFAGEYLPRKSARCVRALWRKEAL